MFAHRTREDIEASLNVALQPSSSGRHLVRYATPEEPFFYLGDTAWELFHRLNDEEAEMFLRNRQLKGFNSIMIVVLAEHGGLEYPNREGHWPFLPSPESTTDRYIPDITKPNPKYFEFIDRVLRMAAKMDMTITLVPTWGRYINGGFHQKPILFNEQNAYTYGKFIADRYPFHPYVLGGDSVRYWNPKTMEYMMSPGKSVKDLEVIDYGPVIEAMAKGVLDGEREAKERLEKEGLEVKGYETLITYHSCQTWLEGYPEGTASAQFPDSPWLNLDSVQTGHYNGSLPSTTSNFTPDTNDGGVQSWLSSGPYLPIRKMYNTMRPDGTPRPVLDLEAHYEATHHWFQPSQPLWTADDIRSGAWQSVFAGAAGYTYGCNSIWQMHNAESTSHPPIRSPTVAYTNWYLELDLPGTFYVAALRRFFLTLPEFFTMRPDSSFILSETNEPNDGSSALDKLIGGLKAEKWVMVHLPYGGSVEVDIVKALSGKGKEGNDDTEDTEYRAWWVDPKTCGRAVLDKGEKRKIRDEPKRVFRSPTEGSLATDWVLFLETYT